MFISRAHATLGNLSRNSILVLSLLLVGALGWLDYASGFEISFSFFYLIPILITTWYAGRNYGYLITFISILTWTISNKLAGQVYSHEVIRYFNSGIRFGVFVMISWMLNELQIVIQNERALARVDDLTGIFNRREFYDRAYLELTLAERYKRPFSLAYFDLDLFKKVNDEMGHQQGDHVLRVITNLVSLNIRKTDTFARLGGDEFALLLPNVKQDDAKHIIPKLVQAVKDEMQAINSPVTLSVGVITFLSPPKSVDEMINGADALMYQAKLLGKNKILYHQYEMHNQGLLE